MKYNLNMAEKDLIDIKEEVYKCSKCALCKSVCPVYIATKNEMFLPRGRFIILNNFFNNKRKLSKTFIDSLDLCLNCNLCKNFCPSSIDSVKIFTVVKQAYKFKFSFFSFSFIYKLLLNLYRIIRFFSRKNSLKRKKFEKENIKTENILFFEGCVNKYIDKNDKNAVLNILNYLGYKNITICSNCCGLPYLSDGETDKFNKNAERIIECADCNYDYIICSCDSCLDTLKKAFKNTDFLSKLISIDEFIKLKGLIVPAGEALYHKPLLRNSGVYLPQGVKTINQKGSVSLMENFIMLKHKQLYEVLKANIFYSDEQINNKTIVTTCQLSRWGLQKNMKNSKVCSYAEYINKLIK